MTHKVMPVQSMPDKEPTPTKALSPQAAPAVIAAASATRPAVVDASPETSTPSRVEQLSASASAASNVVLHSPLVLWLRNFLPAPVGTNAKEGIRMAVGVAFGLLVTAFISRWWGDSNQHEAWIVASMGATAVLVFGMPASPLAQPWPVLVGSLLCLVVGTLCERLIPDEAMALALAVGLSVALMVPLRCLHPPGVGLATFVVLEHAPGIQLLLFPAMFNIVVLLACAVAYNLLTGKRYPHPQHSHRKEIGGGHFTDADLDAALTHYNQVLDISRADLEGLLHLAGRSAFQRTLGDLRCADVMSKPVFAVEPGVSLKEAWTLMHDENVKALPVVDAAQHVVGIISNSDFVRSASEEVPEGLGQRLKSLVMGKLRSQPAKTVNELMSHDVQTVLTTQRVMELVPMFSSVGHHHLPVVDDQSRLVGIITQTDLIRVLAATVNPAAAHNEI